MKLFKASSSGTTALIHPGHRVPQETIAAALDPVAGIGADLFVTVQDTLRAFTPQGEITPPSAVIRMAAALLHSRDSRARSWDLQVEGRDVRVTHAAGEYTINHGPWVIAGGERAIASGHDTVLRFAGLAESRPGLRIRLGERTIAVCALADAAELGSVDLTTAVQTDPAADLVAAVAILGERSVDLTDGSGAVVGTQTIGALQVRGYDRAVGEIYSADALALAGAAAAHTWLGAGAAREWIAVFGGGNTRVELTEHALASAEAEVFADINWLR